MIGSTIRLPRLFHRPILDVRLGFALMRDRRVPLRSKLLAVLIGLAITGLMEFLELPFESIFAMLLPVLGVVGDGVIAGAEMISGPLLIACALLPFLSPRDVVDRIHSERSTGTQNTPVIDI